MTPQYTCIHTDAQKWVGLENEERSNSVCERRGIHVIISLDREHLPGLLPLLTSLLAHTSSPQTLKLHLVLSGMTDKELFQYLSCYPSLPDHVTLDVVQLDPMLLSGLVHVYSSPDQVGNLKSLANFGRFFFHQLFPGLERTLYLDVDVIVRGDIVELWRQLCQSKHLLMAAPRWVGSKEGRERRGLGTFS